MMRLRWTPEAADNLESIYEYLILEMPERARDSIRRIVQEISALRQFPMLGRPVERPGLRALTMLPLPYVCIYEQRDHSITLLHIYHAAQERPVDLQ